MSLIPAQVLVDSGTGAVFTAKGGVATALPGGGGGGGEEFVWSLLSTSTGRTGTVNFGESGAFYCFKGFLGVGTVLGAGVQALPCFNLPTILDHGTYALTILHGTGAYLPGTLELTGSEAVAYLATGSTAFQNTGTIFSFCLTVPKTAPA